MSRQALANNRVQTKVASQVVLTLKTPYGDGTTHLVMSLMEFMQRVAALVPRHRRSASEQFATAPRERLLSGDQLREVNVVDGSITLDDERPLAGREISQTALRQ